MRVLVTTASKHGATNGISATIARTLEAKGLETTSEKPATVESLSGFDAVVLGSAVYTGRWMDDAKEFVERFGNELESKPLWLFSSGPIGDPPKPDEIPADGVKMAERTFARDHRVFAGKLDKSKLGLGEKAIVAAFRSPEGDFRDWEAIRAWAIEIADELHTMHRV
jgi:menaquinone-dependent protoporphyrinogen oxidase